MLKELKKEITEKTKSKFLKKKVELLLTDDGNVEKISESISEKMITTLKKNFR